MVETNIRLVATGMDLQIPGRTMAVESSVARKDTVELACSRIRREHRLAASPLPSDSGLVVATTYPMSPLKLRGEDWEINLRDTGPLVLDARNPAHRAVIPELLERALTVQLKERTKRWMLDSLRQWYEPRPFIESDGIAAFRRASFSALFLDEVGFGVAVDLQTAFFTARSMEWYFADGIPPQERKSRERAFNKLAARERGQGTLSYDIGRSIKKCYFVDAPLGLTCGKTGVIRANGQTYPSLFHYYQATNPKLNVQGDEVAVRVSFQGLPDALPVAARLLRLRIFNDSLPERLKQETQIEPAKRRRDIDAFWREITPNPFGEGNPTLLSGYWRPPAARVLQVSAPVLCFAQQRTLAPKSTRFDDLRSYYLQRTQLLRNRGCYHFPASTSRTVHCAFPAADCDREAAKEFASDVCRYLGDWTGHTFTYALTPYQSLEDGFASLGGTEGNCPVLFVLNQQPSAYEEVALRLNGRRPKRLTADTLQQHYRYLIEGAWDNRVRQMSMKKGRLKWDAFAGLNALNLLTLMDATPWIVRGCAHEAVVALDVGHDRRHYGISVVIARSAGREPAFRLATDVRPKADTKHEAFNAQVLEDEVVRVITAQWQSRFSLLDSLLILRDGCIHPGEEQALELVRARLVSTNILSPSARFEVVELFKDSNKQLRFWDVSDSGAVDNVLEGTAVELNRELLMLADTGRITLHQGTAEPLVLAVKEGRADLRAAATTCHVLSHLNWSNPRVAQSLPYPLARTDEELKARASQEAKHTR